MRQLKGTKASPVNESDLIPIDAIAAKWEVGRKTVENWTEVVFLGFDIVIPKTGEIPQWAVDLVEFVAKHISQKAHLYFAETREARRLKAAEVIQKIHRMRQEGHFQQFDQFRPGAPNQSQEDEDDLEMIAELGAIAV